MTDTIVSKRSCAIGRLRLFRFRNYVEATVHLGPSLNVISGRNAQGKTNLLEAVATLTLTRSPRTGTASDLMHWGDEQCLVEAAVSRSGGDSVLAVRFTRDPGTARVSRATSVDGKPCPARRLLGVCPVVLFWPEDLQLVKAGPEGRRRLLDALLTQLDPRAAAHLLRYRRILQQRNALLHRLRADGHGADALPGFSRELAHHGARVAVARARLVTQLAPLAAAALGELSSGGEHLSLMYAPSHGGSCSDDDTTEQELSAALRDRRPEELARGVTVVGPHRDDVEIGLDGRAARTAASQGQQRSIVLACKLAEMRFVGRSTGTAPVVMLDDVLSELDHERRGRLVALLAAGAAGQVLITTTETLTGLDGFAGACRYTVQSGTVRET